MRFDDVRVGMRVRSLSDGFTGGLTGTVKSYRRNDDDPESVAFVLFDGWSQQVAVAIRLIEPLIALVVPS